MSKYCSAFIALFAHLYAFAQTTVPTGFADVSYTSGLNGACGIVFDTAGRGYVWEKAGRVWIINNNGTKMTPALLNITEEVGNWNEHGLMGFALHPDFYANGYIYIYYTVDRHHLLYYGTPSYSSTANQYMEATINRLVRYQADSATGFTTIMPGSRTVLIGNTKQTGIPVSTGFHDGGSLMFGSDKSLLVGIGDLSISAGGAADTGSYSGTYWAQAIADSILPASHNVGSFRAQMLTSYAGKILRINPITGSGIVGNPYYDSGNPYSVQSKVWALGLRNPFRCTFLPNTGSNDITAANPGTLVISEVGYNKREEIDICDAGGYNFGWPLYEGMSVQNNYMNANIAHPEAMNPLGGLGCTPNFLFKNLLIEDNKQPSPQWRNPCDTSISIPSGIYLFMHKRPIVDYHHTLNETRVPAYSGYNAIVKNIGDTGCNVVGAPFKGECISGTVYYAKSDVPIQYQNSLFQWDYDNKWIKYYKLNTSNEVVAVNDFATSTYAMISPALHPKLGGLFYINYGSQVRRLYYTIAVNNPPIASATASVISGYTPLNVNFNAASSNDVDGDALSYTWLFDDSTYMAGINVNHTFVDTMGTPSRKDVMLIVADAQGLKDTAIVPIFLNCAPPHIDINSVVDSSFYSTSQQSLVPLSANVTDTVYDNSQLKYEWQLSLFHNAHFHPEQIDTQKVTYAIVGPLGCGENYFYKITLKVINPLGLSATENVVLLPDCAPPQCFFSQSADTVCNGSTLQFTPQCVGTGLQYSWTFEGGMPATSNLANPIVQFNDAGYRAVKLRVSNYNGNDSATSNVYVQSPLPIITNGTEARVCKNGPMLTLNASSTNSVAWQWLKNNQPMQGFNTGSAQIAAPAAYSIVATSAQGCIDTSAVIKVMYHNNIDSNIASAPTNGEFCPGGNAILSTTNPSSYSYQWLKADVPMHGKTYPTLTATTGGIYKVQITDSVGCWLISRPFATTVEPKAQFYSYSGNLLCPGDSLLLAALYKPGYTYQWMQNNVPIAGATFSNYFATSAARYHVVVNSALGCSKASSKVKVYSTVCYGIKQTELFPSILEISPIPAEASIQLALINDKEKDITITVYDALGQICKQFEKFRLMPGVNEIELDVSNLANGIYTLSLSKEWYKSNVRIVIAH